MNTYFGRTTARMGTWLSHPGTVPSTPAPRRPGLALLALESREVPAAFSLAAGGVFTIDMSGVASRTADIGTNGHGVVTINSRSSGTRADNSVVGAAGGQLKVTDIRAIVVEGSRDRDIIDLGAVKPENGFGNLNGRVVIRGGDGADTIRGSDFDDEIHGGEKADRIFGYGGNDRIWGDGGDDEIWGDGDREAKTDGNDRIDGGAGADTLHGGGGTNIMVGGIGRDTFWGGSGTDSIWVDGERAPAHGWKWAGIEHVNTGAPPRI